MKNTSLSKIKLTLEDLKYLANNGFGFPQMMYCSTGEVELEKLVQFAIEVGIEKGKSDKVKEIKRVLDIQDP